jgi:peptidoglycan/LPS O-acetylase OafA/YrhL
LDYLVSLGEFGIALLFAITGCLAYQRVMRPDFEFLRYLRARARRVYPAFASVLILTLLWGRASGRNVPLSQLAVDVLLLPGLFPLRPTVPTAWTLSEGLLLTLALPLFARALRLRRRTTQWRVRFLGLLGGVALLAGLVRPVHFFLLYFIAGFWVAESIQTQPEGQARVARRASGALAVALGLPLMHLFTSGGEPLRALWVAALCWSVLRAVLAERTYLMRCLDSPPLHALGEMAFPWYLSHTLVLEMLAVAIVRSPLAWTRTPGFFWTFLPTALLASCAVGGLLSALVERRPALPTVKEELGLPDAQGISTSQ